MEELIKFWAFKIAGKSTCKSKVKSSFLKGTKSLKVPVISKLLLNGVAIPWLSIKSVSTSVGIRLNAFPFPPNFNVIVDNWVPANNDMKYLLHYKN